MDQSTVYNMSLFYDSPAFRRHEHDRISTALAGGHDDDTSCCSLSVDCRTPNFQVREGGNPRMKRLYMYYGDDMQYEVKKVSDIRANDYVFAHRSNSSQDPTDMIAIYEACSKALDDGMFTFQPGEFDCGNMYLEAENLYDLDKPWIEPDRLFPYYFRSGSPIKGRITWDEMNSSDFGLRHVFVINTDLDEDLAAKIPDGTIIYIGGDHCREQLGFSSQYQSDSIDWDLPLKMECKMQTPLMERFSSCSCKQIVSRKGQDDYRLFRDQPASFLSKWCSIWGHASGDTTSRLKHEGYKVYKLAPAEVRKAHGSSQAPPFKIILSFSKAEAGFNSSDCGSLLESTGMNKARETKGSYLTADEIESMLLPSVFKVFGGVVLQLHGDGITLNAGLMSWFMKLLRFSKLMNTSNTSPISTCCFEELGLNGRGLIVVVKMRLDAASVLAGERVVLPRGVFKSFTTSGTRNYSGTQQVGGQARRGGEMFTVIYGTKKSWLSGYIPIYHTLHTGNGTNYLGATSTDTLECWNSDLWTHREKSRFLVR